jgi:NDP-sugar pyrophosphorylase family protein
LFRIRKDGQLGERVRPVQPQIHGTLEKASKAALKIAGKEGVEIVMHSLVNNQQPKND